MKRYFTLGIRESLPILSGVVPFGAVMGTVSADAKLTLAQTMTMNVVMYAGAAQLAAIDLMNRHAAYIVVIISALIINLRFLLYSAALAPSLAREGWFTKFICAHTITDQSYAIVTANQHRLRTSRETIAFYLGTAVAMWITWQSSVVAGFIFGNFAPASWSLDFAVPLSFVALLIPTLRHRKYLIVAAFSSVVSVFLYALPFRTGLIATAALSLGLAAWLTRKKGPSK